MRAILELNEDDLKEVLAEKFEVTEDDISFSKKENGEIYALVSDTPVVDMKVVEESAKQKAEKRKGMFK